MRLVPLLLLICVPLAVLAQNRTNAPLLVVQPDAPAAKKAPVKELVDSDAAPEAAPEPAEPKTPPAPTTPETPVAPEAPAAPISKLWPKDTVPIFMTSCTKFHVEAIKPCTCIITKIMTQMTHEEFIRISEANTLESDPKISAIRQQCTADLQMNKLRQLEGKGKR